MKYVLLVLAFAAAAFGQELPPAPGARVVTLSEPGYSNEPSIAVNPQNSQQVVAAYQKNASVLFSRDGGSEWHHATGIAPKDYRVSGDVSITYDASGAAVLCYIAFDKLGTTNYWGHNATRNGIFIRRSRDGGATWDSQAYPVMAHATTPGIPFEDKPYIVADNTHSRFRGNLYVGWTQFSLTKSVILLARSSDSGVHWSAPIEISTHEGLPRDDNGSVEGFTGAVAPDGTLYAVWADGSEIAFTYSRDGGRSFARSRAILHTAPPYFTVEGVSRANGFPQIGWGPCPAKALVCHPQRGILYVTWSDYRNGDVDVFSATSSDGGRHWARPVRINSDALHSGADQFFQWLAVDAQDGAAYALFYDRRGDAGNKQAIVVLARSIDGGQSWTNYAWTEQPFAAQEDFLGDYTGLAVLEGRVYGVWAEEVAATPSKTEATPSQEKTTSAKPAATSATAADESKKPQHRTVVRVGVADFSGNR